MIENTDKVHSNTPGNGKAQNSFGKAWDFITKPNAALREVGQRRQARLLAGLTFLLTIAVVFGAVAAQIVNGAREEMSSSYAFLAVFVLSLISYIFSRTRHFNVGTILILAAFSLSAHVGALMGINDPKGFALAFLAPAFIISSIMLPLTGIIALTAANMLILGGIAIYMGPGSSYWGTILGQVLVYGTLLSIFSATRNAIERDRLAETNRVNKELQSLSTSLEQRVSERTRDLALAAEVGQRISTVRDLSSLLPDAVELIRQRFDLYYAQIYLVDATEHNLILRAGTGEVGKELLRRSHRLSVDQASINGTALLARHPVIEEDTTQSSIFKPNPLLPETRCEMAIPLVSGDRTLGVLNLQGRHVGELNKENLVTFTTLAGQLATALENSQMFDQVQRNLVEVKTQSSNAARKNWRDYLDGIEIKERIGFVYNREDEIVPLSEPLVESSEPDILTAPLQVSGEQVGAFQFVSDRPWDPEDMNLVDSVSRQVAQQLENLRLLGQAERYRREAETAVRRLTREEWGEYMQAGENAEMSYVYAQDEVQPLEGAVNGSINFDLKVQGEPIGEFGIVGLQDLSPENAELVNAVTEQLSAHLENIRLYSNAQRELEERRKAEELLAKRATELTTVSEVATAVATIQSPEEMLQTVVDLTKVSFGLYHAHIYLVDATGASLVLTKGAGEVGRQMVAEGRQIPLHAEKSLVARAARSRQGVIVNNVLLDADFLPNPLLPGTRSEMAVPLIVGDRLLGVLDIQSDEVGHFDEEDISIQTTLASQVSVALENSRQYEVTQASEKLIHTVIDSTPDWIFIKDQQHRYRLANQGYANSLHIPVETFLDKNDLELGFPEELVKGNPEKGISGFWADDRAVMDGGEPVLIPRDIVMIDGKIRVFNTLKTPLRDANGYVTGVLAFGRDVTEREQILADTETLYEATSQMTRARSYDEVLQVVVDNSIMKEFDNTSIYFFDRPWNENPDTLTIVSVREKIKGSSPLPIGQPIPVKAVPGMEMIAAQSYLVIGDARSDPRLPEKYRLMFQQMNNLAIVSLQLKVGDQLVGCFGGTCSNPIDISETELRRLITLVEQANTVIQSLQLFEAVQARARREQILREITARVRSSMDPDTILRTAVRELGSALGRPAFVRMGSADQLVQRLEGDSKSSNGGNGAVPADVEGGM
jgi:GAF domain-containing protein